MAAKTNKKDWSLVVWMFGWLLALVTTLKKLATKLGVPFEAFERLGSEVGEATLEKVLQLILDDWWQATQPKAEFKDAVGCQGLATTTTNTLLPNVYVLRINRGPLPSISTQEERFSKKGVSPLYDGNHEWKKDRSRAGVNDITDEWVEVLIKDFDSNIRSEAAITWGLEHGWIAADEKEMYAVGTDPKTCGLQLQSWLVGLGSSGLSGGRQYVSVLGVLFSSGRVFDSDRFEGEWPRSRRFVFVRPRKPSK